jgi:glycosidase
MKRTGTALALCLALAGATCACDEPHRSRTYQLPPAADEPRPVIYELVVRLFSNTASVNQWNGDLETNGVGKLEQIDSAAIEGLRELGVTHVWLAGVLQQATATGYPEIGQPADDPDVLKGLAGSIYAVRDYFDICPDYAVDPAQRAEEFAALVDRLHQHELKVIIDLVPNHVARTYHSEIRPDLDFGAGDDPAVFFDPQNDFFYLVEPPGQSLSLPEPSHWPRPDGADGTLESEDNDGVPPGDVPRATGNNVTSPSPGENDWYETIKLNYGYDFTTGAESYDPIPGVWEKMDRVIAHWQGVGVDGFRCDFAHYVPLEAWSHLIDAARERDPDVFFFAEAYEAADAVPGFSFSALVQSGFDAVYDDRTYDTIKGIHCCGRWANDIDGVLPDDYMFDRMLRYAENHDERRIASPLVGGDNPDDSGFGGCDRRCRRALPARLRAVADLQRPGGGRGGSGRRGVRRRRRAHHDLRLLDDAAPCRVGCRPRLRRLRALRRAPRPARVVRPGRGAGSARGVRDRQLLRPAVVQRGRRLLRGRPVDSQFFALRRTKRGRLAGGRQLRRGGCGSDRPHSKRGAAVHGLRRRTEDAALPRRPPPRSGADRAGRGSRGDRRSTAIGGRPRSYGARDRPGRLIEVIGAIPFLFDFRKTFRKSTASAPLMI